MKKKQVEEFFELFVKNFLIGDLLVLNEIKKNEISGLNACTIPQAMTVLSGIDLLGYLFGKNKKSDDSEEHIKEFFRISNTYLSDKYDKNVIEKLVMYRHGMMHNFFPKFRANNIGICKSESKELFLKEMFADIEIESLNVSVLTKDFIFTLTKLEQLIANSFEDSFFDNILTAIKDLGHSNELAQTTMTTINIVTQNKGK